MWRRESQAPSTWRAGRKTLQLYQRRLKSRGAGHSRAWGSSWWWECMREHNTPPCAMRRPRHGHVYPNTTPFRIEAYCYWHSSPAVVSFCMLVPSHGRFEAHDAATAIFVLHPNSCHAHQQFNPTIPPLSRADALLIDGIRCTSLYSTTLLLSTGSFEPSYGL